MPITRVHVENLDAGAVVSTTIATSEATMLALNIQVGDICIRTDVKKTFILVGSDPTVLGNWQELFTIDTANVAITGGSISGVAITGGSISGVAISGVVGSSNLVTGNIIIATNTNSQSFGPITLAPGSELFVPVGSKYKISLFD